MTFKELIYGTGYKYLFYLDTVLSGFKNSDFISNELLYKGDTLPDFENVIRQLEADGTVKISEYGVRITLKGKNMIMKGGYKRKELVKRFVILTIIIGTVTSVFGLLI